MRRSRMTLPVLLFSTLLAGLSFLSGCQTAKATPTVDVQIYTQTAAALATKDFSTRQALDTVAAKFNAVLSVTPTGTPTDTLTPTPSRTFTVTPSLLPTRTRTPLPSATASRTLSPWECRLISQDPKDGTTFKPKANFTVHWVLQNLGGGTWLKTNTDFTQVGGDKVAQLSIYDLTQDVKPLENVEMSVFIIAPDTAGSYSTSWKLDISDTGHLFCPVNMQFWVSDR